MFEFITKAIKRCRVDFEKKVNVSLLDEVFGIVAGIPLSYLIVTGEVTSLWAFIPIFLSIVYIFLLVVIIHLNSISKQFKKGCLVSIVYFFIASNMFLYWKELKEFGFQSMVLSGSGIIWLSMRLSVIKLFDVMHKD